MRDSGPPARIPGIARPDPRSIVFVVYDDFQSLDLSGPWEAFAHAEGPRGRHYRLSVASLGGRRVTSSSDLAVGVDLRLGDVEAADTLVVVGGTGTRQAVADPRLITEIGRLASASRRVAGVCSGAFLLAQAGLLDGRRAVTHWAHCDRLARAYPRVEVDPDPIWVRDGKVITSAGVTAGIDLALALIEEDHGPEVALRIARELVVFARRPGGQAQFSVQLAHQSATLPPLQELLGWVAEHPDEDLSVAALADRLHLSERHFTRIFRRELGASPADYVEQLRVEAARRQLEEGEDGLEIVARRSGFSSAEVMRRAFQRRLATSPREYRDRFRVAA